MDYREIFEQSAPLGGARHERIRITPEGTVLKRCTKPKKAQKEFHACSQARALLGPELRPYEHVSCSGGIFITNRVEGVPLDGAVQQHVCRAADYMGRIHVTPITRKQKALLSCHYGGKRLVRRLKRDAAYAANAFGMEATRCLRDSVSRVARRVRWHRDVVAGHGDFRAGNILVTALGVHPVDWVDFGLCLRAYEVAHFLDSISEELHSDALASYYLRAPRLSAEDMALGQAVNAVIRSGSFGRSVQQGRCSREDAKRMFDTRQDELRRAVATG